MQPLAFDRNSRRLPFDAPMTDACQSVCRYATAPASGISSERLGGSSMSWCCVHGLNLGSPTARLPTCVFMFQLYHTCRSIAYYGGICSCSPRGSAASKNARDVARHAGDGSTARGLLYGGSMSYHESSRKKGLHLLIQPRFPLFQLTLVPTSSKSPLLVVAAMRRESPSTTPWSV